MRDSGQQRVNRLCALLSQYPGLDCPILSALALMPRRAFSALCLAIRTFRPFRKVLHPSAPNCSSLFPASSESLSSRSRIRDILRSDLDPIHIQNEGGDASLRSSESKLHESAEHSPGPGGGDGGREQLPRDLRDGIGDRGSRIGGRRELRDRARPEFSPLVRGIVLSGTAGTLKAPAPGRRG